MHARCLDEFKFCCGMMLVQGKHSVLLLMVDLRGGIEDTLCPVSFGLALRLHNPHGGHTHLAWSPMCSCSSLCGICRA